LSSKFELFISKTGKKILRKHGYPPDMELKATETVIEQAKLLANDFNSKAYESDSDYYSMAAEPEG
jgi:type I restriction enzyme R subunit